MTRVERLSVLFIVSGKCSLFRLLLGKKYKKEKENDRGMNEFPSYLPHKYHLGFLHVHFLVKHSYQGYKNLAKLHIVSGLVMCKSEVQEK